MFTGLIETVGTVTALRADGARAELVIDAPAYAAKLDHGESIAVNGVCLTVAKSSGGEWVADLMKVTLDATALGALKPGARVNLERAMRADGRFGGHMVQGHADAVATVTARDSQPDWDDVTVEIPAELARYVVEHGSIALNGVSLTVARLDGGLATVSLIPTTLAETNLGDLAVGDPVNVEVDVMAKYVEKMVANRG